VWGVTFGLENGAALRVEAERRHYSVLKKKANRNLTRGRPKCSRGKGRCQSVVWWLVGGSLEKKILRIICITLSVQKYVW